MQPEFEDPNLASFAIDVKLRVRIVAKVLEEPKVFPPPGSDRFVSPACDQRKAVERELLFLLLNQTSVRARQSLFADLTCRRVGESLTLQPIVVRILSSTMKTFTGSHDRGADNPSSRGS